MLNHIDYAGILFLKYMAGGLFHFAFFLLFQYYHSKTF